MIVYSNSCSFGSTHKAHRVYPEYVAQAYGAELINRGVPGSCNRKIIRNSLRDLIALKNKSGITALIGLTFISRTELWQPWIEPIDNDGHFFPVQVDHKKIDWSINGFNTVISEHLTEDSRIQDYYKHWLLHYHPESAVTELLTDIIMFCGWADNNNIKYQLFSNVDVLPGDDKIGYTSPFIQSLQQQILENKNIINPWEFSFGTHSLSQGFVPRDYHLFKNHGHPGEDAHKVFSELLLDRLKQNI